MTSTCPATHQAPTVTRMLRATLLRVSGAFIWSILWRLIMSFLMVTTFVFGMWLGIVSPAVANAMSQQQAQLLHTHPHHPPVSAAPTRAKNVHPNTAAACPSLTSTPEVGNASDINGQGTLGFYTMLKQTLTDQLTLQENVANGNVVLQANDLTLHGTGLDLSIASIYNSQSNVNSTLGNNWNLSVGNGVYLTFDGNNVIVHGASGFQATYEDDDSSYGGYTEPPSLDATLFNETNNPINGASYVLVTQQTSECLGFSATGLELFDQDRNLNQISYTYNNANLLTSITDTQARLTTFSYDSNGRISQITDPIGRTILYSYDANNMLKTMTDMAGNITTFGYSSSGNLISISEPDGQLTTLSYQSGHMVTTLTDATTAVTSFGYYSSSASQCSSVNDSDEPCTLVTVTPNTTPENTTYLYNGLEVQYVQDANGNMEATTYTPDAFVSTYTDPLLDQTVFNYDTGNTNNLMSTVDANGATTSFDYDNSDPYLLTQETGPQGFQLTYSYDNNGNLQKVQDTTDDGTNTTVTYAYNPNGTLQSSTDGDNNQTSYSYFADGNLKKVTPSSPLGTISYTYDGASRITSITDGKGQLTQFSYDKLDHITQITYNDGGTITYTYDAEGNVKSVVDNTGTTTFKYDADNRTVKKTLPNGSVISTGYDHVGNLTTYSDSGGTVTYGYTPVNLVHTITEPDNAVTTFEYTNANQRKEIDYPNGAMETLEYDKAGHLSELEVTNSQKQSLISLSYSYQIPNTSAYSNLLQTMSFQDPVNPQNGMLTWLYSYDSMSRLTEATLQNSSSDVIDDFQYSYDTAGNRTAFQRPSQHIDTSYTYNSAEGLTSQVNGSQSTSYSYDQDGNLTGMNNSTSFSYNGKNQTTAISGNTYTYSGSDSTERVQTNSDQFVYSGLGLMSKTDASGKPVVSYTRCSCGMLLAETLPGQGKYYYILDAQESVVGLMDSKGNLVNAYVYDPFGNSYEETTGVANPWQYAGGYLDNSTGLYKMGTRYYNPTLGRWTQEDPVGPQLTNPDSLNPYLYVDDSPSNGTDPSGKFCIFFSNSALDAIGWIDVGIGSELGILALIGTALFPPLIVFLAIIGAIGILLILVGSYIVWEADKWYPNGATICI